MGTSWILRIAVVALAALGLFALACDDDDGVDPATGDVRSGSTLDDVLARGELKCGVKDSQPGFGFLEPDGSFSGFDIEICRAVAAAVLGDAGKVQYVPATAANRFELLASREVDVLIRTTTWTASRDADLNGAFAVTTFYDGQGILVRVADGVRSIGDLEGATVCVTTGTTTEGNLEDAMKAAGVSYTPLGLDGDDPNRAAFIEGRCDAWTADRSNLVRQRAAYPEDEGGPSAVALLPQTFSKEPLGPVTRDNDSEWFDVVNWVVIGMINADELGVTSANVAALAADPPTARIARLLGASYEGGAPVNFGLGIPADFMQRVLSQVGNYDEAYARTLGALGLPRAGTLNDSWLRGGILYASPMR